MKLPAGAHFSRPWRIHAYTAGFRLTGVWALPTPAGPDDFPRLVAMLADFADVRRRGSVVGLLLAVREALGAILGWGGAADDPGRPSLRHRLAPDLRASPGAVTPPMGFAPLYQIGDEWAAELINRTVHGVIHLSWVRDAAGCYGGPIAMLVRRNGVLGRVYLAVTAPFRHLVIYPRLRSWLARRWVSAPEMP